MKISIRYLSLIATLSGCASTLPVPHTTAVKRTPIQYITNRTLAVDYAAERSYRQDKDTPLQLGLALSGGGTKAAMFAHGVLNGLYNQGILQKVDVISTVSGGGYAAYWYYTKLLEADREAFSISDIFRDCLPTYWTRFGTNQPQLTAAMKRAAHPELREDPDPRAFAMDVCGDESHFSHGDPYRWQTHLVRWPDVFGTDPVPPSADPRKWPEKAIRKGLFDGLFVEPFTHKLTGRESSIPMLYQWGIGRTWGLNPQQRAMAHDKWRFSNALNDANGAQAAPLRVDPAKVDWQALRDLHARALVTSSAPHIPLWIINANAGGKTDDPGENTTRIFEMTAFGSGAEKFGYVNDIAVPPIKDIGTSVRAAAGFADAQGLTSYKRFLLERVSSDIPGARWGVDTRVATRSGANEKTRLSDGGGGENLGLYSLLRRGVRDIIVVDTAQDIDGTMSDLCAVKKALPTGFEMKFPALDEFESVCERGRAYNMSDWKNPVVLGTVTWPESSEPRQSRIWLIKAAWNQQWMRKTYNGYECGNKGYADCLLTVFYGHNTSVLIHGKNDPKGNMVFPQLPTAGTTANASSYLFWGYRELGRSYARQLAWDVKKGGLTLPGDVCRQPAADMVKNDRPYPLAPLENVDFCPPLKK